MRIASTTDPALATAQSKPTMALFRGCSSGTEQSQFKNNDDSRDSEIGPSAGTHEYCAPALDRDMPEQCAANKHCAGKDQAVRSHGAKAAPCKGRRDQAQAAPPGRSRKCCILRRRRSTCRCRACPCCETPVYQTPPLRKHAAPVEHGS